MVDPTVDEAFMDQALDLAERGRGQTSPNPMVGAVLVAADAGVVGTGYHERAGGPHAEIRALENAGQRAQSATLYCTLEPCSHVGRTGPCAHRIVDAGVRRVVVGLVDPNPRVAGTGIAYLRTHGVQVDVGVREDAVAHQNEVFLTWVERSRPFVIMKIATSRDGKVAARPGVWTSLTSDDANRVVHGVRAEVDAIGVGSGTLLVDDPLLTARLVPRARPLVRVIFDRRLRTPPDAQIFTTLERGPVLILTTGDTLRRAADKAAALRAVGGEVENATDGGIGAALKRLAERDITSILLEGGTTIHRAAWEAGAVDRVLRFVAPVDLGAEGVSWLDSHTFDTLGEVRTERCGQDVLIDGYVHRVG